MLGGWLNRVRCPIGLDIGAHSIKMLQLERHRGALSVVAADERKLDGQAQPGDARFRDAAVSAIRAMLDDGRFVGHRVVSALPDSGVTYKNLRIPKMPADELRTAVEWEAAERLHVGADDVSIQYFDAGEVRQGDELREEIIVVAADTKAIDHHLKLLQACELSPVAIEVAPAALARCLTPPVFEAEPGAAHVVVDVGYTASKVLVVRDGRVVFFKPIDLGGRRFDEAVAQHLNLPVRDAVELRQRSLQTDDQGSAESGASTRHRTLERKVYEAMRTVVGELAKELSLCLRYYSVTFRGRRPEVLLLVGGEAYDPHVARVLAEGTGMDLAVHAPLEHVGLSRVADRFDVGRALCEWAVPLGLSMRMPGAVRRRAAA